MNDDFFDAEATRRVAHRALVSAALAFVGGFGGVIVPLSSVVVIPLLVVAIAVAISAILTLNHHEAAVIGRVGGGQLGAQLLDARGGHLEQLREQLGLDGLVGHHQDRLDGSARVVAHRQPS